MEDILAHLMHEFTLPLSNPVLIFSLILFIILLSPIVLKKLNIPGIIGLIISGVIIGPYGFGILENDSAIHLFSTIGILYIMFIAGLELDMNEFKVNKNKSFLFGFFTFFIPMAMGFPVCYYLLGYDFNASILTTSMFATHTLVAYPIVSKLGVSKNQAVAVTVGGTILTDAAVLITLAVIVENSQGNLNQSFWINLGLSLAIFSVIVFYVVPKFAKWFFKKLESERHSHYIFVLAVVFFVAFLAEVIGLEPIIGAFVAGLALNRLIPQSSALMNRIEFIGNSLFIPFFLISVGMLVNINVIFSGTTALLVAGVLSIVAIATKWFAAWFTQIIFKYSKLQRQLIFGLSSSRAAATLAVILVGYQAGIVDETILNGTVILILITCIISSFVTERAAKKIAISDENVHISVPDSVNNEHILVPIANVSNFGKLLEFALLIKEKKSANPVSILSVVPNNEEAEQNIIKSRNKLEEYVKQASATEIKANIITTIDFNAASGIARASREIMANIIIIGWPKRSGILDKLVGEKIESIINSIDKNLFISHFDNNIVQIKRIVVLSPALAERENGFELWIQKVVKLSQELSIDICHYGDIKTSRAIKEYLKARNLSVAISFELFSEWEDFLVLSRKIHDDDLLVLISARRGSVSYTSILDNIPTKLGKHFENNSKIVIYPQQYNKNHHLEGYEDVYSGPITKGIEVIEKGIGNMFRKKG